MRRLLIFTIAISILLIGCTDADIPQRYPDPLKPAIQTETKVKSSSFEDLLKNIEKEVEEESDYNDLSNDNYYINSKGNKVHSPAYAPSIPTGASAKCRDGTYSFSQSRRGTCSHHGGVAEWY